MTDHVGVAPARVAYSMAEAAQALGVSINIIKLACYQGLIRSRKLGALRRIPAVEVERLAIEGMPVVAYPPRSKPKARGAKGARSKVS
jgi:hypothetical protein